MSIRPQQNDLQSSISNPQFPKIEPQPGLSDAEKRLLAELQQRQLAAGIQDLTDLDPLTETISQTRILSESTAHPKTRDRKPDYQPRKPQPTLKTTPIRQHSSQPRATSDGLLPTEFQDTAGRVWNLSLTLAAARRIDSSDFSAIYERKFSILVPDQYFTTEVLTNPALIAAMTWACIRPRAEELDIEEADFLEAIDGTSLVAMRAAFWEAFLDFTQEQRTALEPLLRKYKTTQAKVAEASQKIADEIDPMIDAEIQREVEEMMTQIRSKLRKTPEPSPGEA